VTDQITLTMPRERPFFGVARLVLAGLAARLDVTVEHLEDLELALDGLLERRDGAEQITLSLSVDGDDLQARIGPYRGGAVRAELEGEPGENLTLRRLLDAVVDKYEVEDRADGSWVEIGKRLKAS
jgi:anti-sigma regulatory factor (Ser/Thr protein kinase)